MLLPHREPPCLSLYPTHRQHPDNQQVPIRFKNLVRALDESLWPKFPAREARPLLAPFDALAADRGFWNHTLDGLAVLAAPGIFKVYRLQRPVAALAVVADSFHTKPLLRIRQSADRYQVLALDRRTAQLLRATAMPSMRSSFAAGVPRTIADALGDEVAGRFDAATGARTPHDLEHPEVDDLLDDIGEHVLRAGGEVVVVPAERMPTRTGLAAIYE